jgi:hypothetical protein
MSEERIYFSILAEISFIMSSIICKHEKDVLEFHKIQAM